MFSLSFKENATGFVRRGTVRFHPSGSASADMIPPSHIVGHLPMRSGLLWVQSQEIIEREFSFQSTNCQLGLAAASIGVTWQ